MLRKTRNVLCLALFTFLLLGSSMASAQGREPLKIGFIASMTGTFAQIGKDMADGASLYLEEIKHTMAGRKIEFIRD